MGSYAGFWFFCPAQKNNALTLRPQAQTKQTFYSCFFLLVLKM